MTELPIEEFPGLDLASDPYSGAGAVDCLNVDLTRPGQLRTRPPTNAQFTPADYIQAMLVLEEFDLYELVYVDASGNMKSWQLDTGSHKAGTGTTGGGSPWGMARFGTATSSYVYIGGTSKLWRYNPAGGGTFTSITIPLTNAYFPTVTSSFRLALRDDNDTVYFSNPGAAETFTYSAGPPATGDFVKITPNDGQYIAAMVEWNGEMFVFKQSKFAVFGTNSESSTGGAVFNFRMVENVPGCDSFNGAIATPDGVYFVNRDGIFLTTGGTPVRVSQAIDPWLRGQDLPFYSGADFSAIRVALGYWNGRLLVSYRGQGSGSGVANTTLVFANGQWSVWDFDATAFTTGINVHSSPADPTNAAHLFYGTTAPAVRECYEQAGTHPSSAYYQSSYSDLGSPDVKVVRQYRVFGTGTVSLSTGVDGAAPGSGSSLALGTAPVPDDALRRVAGRGRLHSFKLSAAGPWLVNRMSRTVRDARSPGSDA